MTVLPLRFLRVVLQRYLPKLACEPANPSLYQSMVPVLTQTHPRCLELTTWAAVYPHNIRYVD